MEPDWEPLDSLGRSDDPYPTDLTNTFSCNFASIILRITMNEVTFDLTMIVKNTHRGVRTRGHKVSSLALDPLS